MPRIRCTRASADQTETRAGSLSVYGAFRKKHRLSRVGLDADFVASLRGEDPGRPVTL